MAASAYLSSLLVLLSVAAVYVEGLSHHRGGSSDSPVLGEADFKGDTFDLPEGFLIGAGTAAIQVEGNEFADGKGMSVLNKMFENPQIVGGTEPPGMAADSYHRYKEDAQMAKDLKLQVYRFSISWPRVLPEGDLSKVNQAGVDYYNNLIDELILNGIQPMITMNHFDYPLAVLAKTGGWVDSRIVPMFEAYADFLFERFGDRVKWWTTVNEPNYYCMTFALLPVAGMYEPQPGDDYKCVHNTILAHMRAYRLYQDKYKAKQQGKIGAAALTLWCTPNSTSYEDIKAAERANLFALGSIYHPVVFGDYPAALRERVDHYSKLEGRTESRLPHFTQEEQDQLKGSADFLCFNAYMGTVVADATFAPRPETGGTIASDRDAVEIGTTTVPGKFGDLFMHAEPWVLREAPKWIHENYHMPLFITENGWGDSRASKDYRHDKPRVGYHSEYLSELMRAREEDGVELLGYLVWSLLDSWEFSSAFDRRFGLVHVDYEGGSLNRTLKDSAWFFQYIGEHGKVPRVEFDNSSGNGGAAGAPVAPLTLAAMALVALFASKRVLS